MLSYVKMTKPQKFTKVQFIFSTFFLFYFYTFKKIYIYIVCLLLLTPRWMVTGDASVSSVETAHEEKQAIKIASNTTSILEEDDGSPGR